MAFLILQRSPVSAQAALPSTSPCHPVPLPGGITRDTTGVCTAEALHDFWLDFRRQCPGLHRRVPQQHL